MLERMRRLVAAIAAVVCSPALAGCADAEEQADAPGPTMSRSEPPESETERGTAGPSSEGEPTQDPDQSAPPSEDEHRTDEPRDRTDSEVPAPGSRAYCAAVDDLRTEFDLSDASVDGDVDIDGAARALRTVTGVAPDAIAEQWGRLARTFERVRSMLRRHDIDLSDPHALEDLDQQAYTDLLRAVRDYKAPDIVSAARSVELHVQRSCGFSMR